MDEMKLKLSTRFMRNIAAKLIARTIYKKTGCKVDIHLNELDVYVVDGEARISTSVEAKLNSNEFMKLMKNIGLED
jgi:hypothetical protein